jgi:hypothetical protein
LILGLTLIANQAFADQPKGPTPTQGAATCIAGFTPTPATWNSTTATSYVCKSSVPACANGTKSEGNVAAMNGPLVSEPGQHNVGQSKNGYFFYTCAVPANVKPTT